MLGEIQAKLKAPKGRKNEFGGFDYRSAEDILREVKPYLNGAVLTLSDEMVEVGGRVYVKATARLSRESDPAVFETTAYAREPLSRKGMDESQVTGSASSYARKYALAGLFAIDNTKDADTAKGPSIADQIASQTNYNALKHYWTFLSESEQAEHLDQFKKKAAQLKPDGDH